MRTLPKLLKYLPHDKAQDARNFMLSFQYWLGGSSDNLQNFLVILTDRYVVDEPLKAALASPFEYPALGIWHPLAPNMFTDTLTTSGTTLALSWRRMVLSLVWCCSDPTWCPRTTLSTCPLSRSSRAVFARWSVFASGLDLRQLQRPASGFPDN